MTETTTLHEKGIRECCKKLRISSNMADRAVEHGNEAQLEFLYRVLNEELASRQRARVEKLTNTAGFPRRYVFDQFEATDVQFPPSVSCESLRQLDFYHDEEKRNIVMYGRTGTGKTMLSICIGIEACKQGIPVQFARTAALVNLLAESAENGHLSAVTKKLKSASILILDEFGYVPYNRTGSQLLFELLSEIDEAPGKVVILNTNLEFSSWVNVLYDGRMAEALVGRLMHHCDLLLFPGDNRRLRAASAKVDHAKRSDISFQDNDEPRS